MKMKMHRNEWKGKHNNSKSWDTVKAVLRGRFIVIQAYLKKQEKKSNKQPNSTPKATRKVRNVEPQLVEEKKY